MLDVERRYCARNAARWLKEFPGKVLVIKGETLLGAYDSVSEALSAGANRVARDSLLARAAGHHEQTVAIPGLSLGIIPAEALRPAGR